MKIVKTQEEINEFIEELKLNKTQCNQFNIFNDDNHAVLDANIDFLMCPDLHSYEAIDEEYNVDACSDEDEIEQTERNHADCVAMLEWLHGETENADHLFPVK